MIILSSQDLISGFLIVGGTSGSGRLSSIEEFNPSTKNFCKVGDLPQGRYHGSLCNSVYCGGRGGDRSCVKVEGGNFTQMSANLVQKRAYHLCWGLPSGEILLMGGFHSKTTTERLSADGSSSSPDFNLPYPTRYVSWIKYY